VNVDALPTVPDVILYDLPGSGPYATAALAYRAAGWAGVLPVGDRPRQKTAPPGGYTGHDGAWPSDEQVDAWRRDKGAVNVALRVPPGVLGIDVDAYDGKLGADTMAAAAAAHGRLPATWRSTSRDDGVSGIYLFRVPDGATFPGMLVHPERRRQSHVELIQSHHRYAVAAPSIHPEGREYRWIGPTGDVEGPPLIEDLPELPGGWQAHLAQSCECFAVPDVILFTSSSPRDPVADKLAEARAALRAGSASRHDGVLAPALALVGFRNRQAPGAADALEQLHGEYVAAITAPGAGRVESRQAAEREWRRMTEGGRAATAGVGMPAWDAGSPAMRSARNGSAPDDADPTTIGTRTAADLRSGMPPAQLAGHFLTPEGPTILYARGGTGKGLVTCWLIAQLVRAGHVVMVLDYEGHEREWGSRLRGVGLADDELRQVHYRAPFGPEWTAQTGPLSVVAPAVRDDCARLAVTYLVVDSYSVATSNGDTMGGEQAAREYFTALAAIGLPSLTIAHVRGDSSRFPERPFGSVFVHNLARESWAVEKIGEQERDPFDDTGYAPAVVALELRNQKSNGRAKAPAQFVTFSFYADGTITLAESEPVRRPVADLAADVLAEGPMTLAQIISAIKEDDGRAVSEDSLRTTLRRHPDRFSEATSGRPRKWAAA
jgi:hypothetical protein